MMRLALGVFGCALLSFVVAKRRGGRRRYIEEATALEQQEPSLPRPQPLPPQHPLIAPLFRGPIDIVGDVHGESGALHVLLDRLGYDGNGRHPDGRRLVFVGDLVDRGPDSPGVLRLVRHLMAQGAAQCILGNHELNLLTEKRKSPAPKAPPAPKRISIASAIDSAPNTSQPSDSSGLTRTSH